jgi:hypothetical protein
MVIVAQLNACDDAAGQKSFSIGYHDDYVNSSKKKKHPNTTTDISSTIAFRETDLVL